MRRYRISEKGALPHFVTWSVVDWLPIFTSETYCRIMTDSLAFCRSEKGLLVHGYVIMPTHVHGVFSAGDASDLSGIIRDARKFVSREVVGQLAKDGNRLFDWVFRDAARKEGRPEGSYKVWQSGSHPETLASPSFLVQKLEYIHNNPVRKGLVQLAEHWRFSSAGAYICQGRDEPLEIDLLEW